MDSIVWSFSNDNDLGTHIASIGFNAQADGPGIDVKARVQLSNEDPTGTSFTLDCEDDRPPTQYGLILLHAVATCDGAGPSIPADIDVEYGGEAMTFDAFGLEGSNELHIFAYLWIGDGSELADDELLVDLGPAFSEALFGIELQYIEGIAQASPTFLEAGTASTYTSPLDLDPGPDPTEWDFVATAAAQAVAAGGQSTLSISTSKYLPLEPIRSSTVIGRTASYLCDTSYNCDCDTDPNARTLDSMRTELLRRVGYASQATNPPPGVEELMTSYLQSAQRYLWHRYQPLQTRRLFSWALRPGVRYYGLPDSLQCCAGALDRYRIEGAWIQDPNNTWWPLVYGINPTFYTLDQNIGWPNFYEIRQCIELFPAPMGLGYKLWIKGGIALLPFEADDDTTTLDAGPVFDWAVGLAKSHKGDRDAGLPTPGKETGYYGMAIRQVKELIGRSHVTRRYIPGTSSVPIAVPPVMVHFDS